MIPRVRRWRPITIIIIIICCYRRTGERVSWVRHTKDKIFTIVTRITVTMVTVPCHPTTYTRRPFNTKIQVFPKGYYDLRPLMVSMAIPGLQAPATRTSVWQSVLRNLGRGVGSILTTVYTQKRLKPVQKS